MLTKQIPFPLWLSTNFQLTGHDILKVFKYIWPMESRHKYPILIINLNHYISSAGILLIMIIKQMRQFVYYLFVIMIIIIEPGQ